MNFRDVMEELLHLQEKTNCGTINDNWRSEKLEWELEIMAELGEAIESSEHKWWKDNNLDLDNIKVEIIDMLHFAMSADMTRFEIEVVKSCKEPKWDNTDKEFSQERFVEGCKDVIAAVGDVFLSFNHSTITPSVLELANDVGMNLEEIRRIYIGKNALNLVRQENKYKEGEYKKQWGEEEDNVWVMNYIKENPKLGFDTLVIDIGKFYRENII